MFTDKFYARFDTRHKFLVYENDTPVYGKELQKAMERQYPNLSLDERKDSFRHDLDDAFRDYAKACHIKVRYDLFTEEMKEHLRTLNPAPYLCEIQKMTRKELFLMFRDADINTLYDVASLIFSYVEENDPHED